jgi:hypothetical protein
MNKNLIAALAEIENLPYDSKGHNHEFTSLPAIMAHIRPIMAKHSLGFIHDIGSDTLEDGTTAIKVRAIIVGAEGIVFEGGWASCSTKGLRMANEAQQVGSVISYLKRYTAGAAVGLATEEDVDSVVGKTAKATPKPKAKAPTPKTGSEAPAKMLTAIRATMREAFGNDVASGKDFYKSIGVPASSGDFTMNDAVHCLEQLKQLQASDK